MTSKWIIDYIKNTGVVDEIDAGIINQLIDDSSQSTQSVADAVGINRSTAHLRIKKLRERGIISAFTMELNYSRCGLPLRVFILVGYDTRAFDDEITQRVVAKKLSKLKYVTQVDIITGAFDFLVELAIDDMSQLGDVIIEEMRKIKGVGSTQTLLSFKNFKDGYEVGKQ